MAFWIDKNTYYLASRNEKKKIKESTDFLTLVF